MAALNIQKGASSHSAYDLRDPNAQTIESHTLAVLVEKHENCFPMIPSGKPHNEMLLGEASTDGAITGAGGALV